jgi:hypothetical protein
MRPTILHVDGTLYWTIRTYNPDTSVLKDADSTPTVAVRKNGASTGDSVTITKRSATTGIYDCSYDPASEVEGDEFVIEEAATLTGTTTTQATYSQSWSFTVTAIERGTNDAATAASITTLRGADNDTLKTLSDQIDGIESGGLTSEQAAALTRIDTKTALITGSKLSVAGAVTPGGDITLVIGDDRVSAADSELLRSITDTSGALHTRLAAASQVTFGAGRNGVPDLITGTVTSSYSVNVTTLTIEIDQAGVSTDAIASEDYTYQIQRVTADGDHVIEVSGNLTLLDRYAARTQ